MKKLVLSLALVAIVASVAWGAGKSYDDYTGTISVEVDGADSTGMLTSSPIATLVEDGRQKYDGFVGEIYIGDFLDPGDSAVESYGDTAIIKYWTSFDRYQCIIEVDTILMPGTCFVAWHEDIWADPTATTWIGGDSTSAYGYIKPKLSGDYPALQLNTFYIDYYLTDSAGTVANLTNSFNYKFRFFKDDSE